MYGRALLSLLLALLAASSTSTDYHRMGRGTEEFCKLGTTFLSGCNTCICGANNKPSFCFPKACNYEIPVGIKPCVPGTTLMVECNRCTCGINGKPQQCTKNKCSSSSEPVKRSRFRSMTAQFREDKCVPGTMLKKSCNTCKCSKSGRPIQCTNFQCHPLLGVGVQGCMPGDLVKVYCSTCKCSSTGILTDCTTKDCDIRAAPNQGGRATCVPGTTYMDDCNKCICEPDGTSGACTKRLCKHRRSSPDIGISSDLEDRSKHTSV
ncbi:laminin subunit alpha-5-like [Schistocerca nitens]|uniref:laminin subunit alpha-5-like n=1 Tax=Schistocerca nitens TaxID=7011 RepID=UPI0021190267|nr:laminin subunit alpha-5-like [Schistocerca nitens]